MESLADFQYRSQLRNKLLASGQTTSEQRIKIIK